jgi:putative nucleotidyltransferase with HDIG domain
VREPQIETRRAGDDELLRALAAVVEDLTRQPSRADLLARACRGLTELLGATGCLVSRLEGPLLRDAAAFASASSLVLGGYDYLLDDYPQTQSTIEGCTPRTVSLSDRIVDPGEAFVLRELGMHAVLLAPLWVSSRPWGLAEVYAAAPRRFDDVDLLLARTLLAQTAAALATFEHAEAVDLVYRETLASLANALEAKDVGTSEHTQDVVRLAVETAAQLGLGREERRIVELGALLHDIGKIQVSEAILRKPGPLDDREWTVMRSHPELGERILAPMTSLAAVLPVVRSSHERWDGGGYPDGLVGEAIPLGARIVAVCDAYCAMTESRPYRERVSSREALAEIDACSGTQFDPGCVDALRRVLDAVRPIRLHRPDHLVR